MSIPELAVLALVSLGTLWLSWRALRRAGMFSRKDAAEILYLLVNSPSPPEAITALTDRDLRQVLVLASDMGTSEIAEALREEYERRALHIVSIW